MRTIVRPGAAPVVGTDGAAPDDASWPLPRLGLGRALLKSARPKQWIKNGFVLVPIAFGGAIAPIPLARTVAVMAAFCLASSSLYLINDICDRDADRAHSRKRTRPIASGRLSIRAASTAAAIGLVVALSATAAASPLAATALGLYMVLTIAYSVRLKDVVILDVLIIASGFVIRIAAGAAASSVVPSEWLLICTLFLALFLGFGKRYHELLMLGETANDHRPVLNEYSRESLNQFLGATMLGTLFSYVLYTFFSVNATNHRGLMVTIPFAVYGIFRYMLLVQTHSEGGSPEEILLSDRPIQLAAASWMVIALAVIYLPHLSSAF